MVGSGSNGAGTARVGQADETIEMRWLTVRLRPRPRSAAVLVDGTRPAPCLARGPRAPTRAAPVRQEQGLRHPQDRRPPSGRVVFKNTNRIGVSPEAPPREGCPPMTPRGESCLKTQTELESRQKPRRAKAALR